jgi:hypothetical protein
MGERQLERLGIWPLLEVAETAGGDIEYIGGMRGAPFQSDGQGGYPTDKEFGSNSNNRSSTLNSNSHPIAVSTKGNALCATLQSSSLVAAEADVAQYKESALLSQSSDPLAVTTSSSDGSMTLANPLSLKTPMCRQPLGHALYPSQTPSSLSNSPHDVVTGSSLAEVALSVSSYPAQKSQEVTLSQFLNPLLGCKSDDVTTSCSGDSVDMGVYGSLAHQDVGVDSLSQTSLSMDSSTNLLSKSRVDDSNEDDVDGGNSEVTAATSVSSGDVAGKGCGCMLMSPGCGHVAPKQPFHRHWIPVDSHYYYDTD